MGTNQERDSLCSFEIFLEDDMWERRKAKVGKKAGPRGQSFVMGYNV